MALPNSNKKSESVPITVSELNTNIKNILQKHMSNAVEVTGEITNYKSSNGNIYFTLKDANATISVVVWSGSQVGNNVDTQAQNGDNVVVKGKINCWQKSGSYQINCTSFKKIGLGVLHEQYEKSKQEFEQNGYFSKKRKLPSTINKLAILTAKDGAAIQDILYVLEKNKYAGEIHIKNCFVQGEKCSDSIKNGIEYFNKLNNDTSKFDLLLLTRGGGSFEDLMGFSDEKVVKAVYESNIVTVSAVGHEVDTMLSDLSADYRAPTPSIAAEIISLTTKSNVDLLDKYESFLKNKRFELSSVLKQREEKIGYCKSIANANHPTKKIDSAISDLTSQMEKYTCAIGKILDMHMEKINKIKQYDVSTMLKKGYSVVVDNKNNIIDSKEKMQSCIEKNKKIKIIFSDGTFTIG